MTGRILLLDAASLYYRAFFGVPDSLTAPDGTVVNALRGLIDFVSRLSTDYGPDSIVACWDDDWRPQWRVDLIGTYKSHRLADGSNSAEETPDLLAAQVPLIAEALALLGIPVVGAPDCEADDIIGTIATSWPGPVEIVTGDRDLFQLVDDNHPVRVLYTARGVAKHDIVDATWVRSKYGIEPAQYVDFAVMRGDPSDGIPGIAGIGDKTAAKLLASFADLSGIQSAAQDMTSDIKPKVRASINASAEYIAAARKVVAVRRDALGPGTYALTEEYSLTELTAIQRDEFESFGKRWGLGGVVTRALVARSR